MNISATLNIFKLIRDPALCLPHSTISTFNHLPIPLPKAFTGREDIRAVVLDKDNCFAAPHENAVYKPYHDKFQELRKAYPGNRLLIVSNSAGTDDDPNGLEADILERDTGVKVLRHSTKKPGCRSEIVARFLATKDSVVTSPEQIAVVGDRLFTDVMMANMMGSYAVWVKDGVVQEKNFFTRMEMRLSAYLLRNGWQPPAPKSVFR